MCWAVKRLKFYLIVKYIYRYKYVLYLLYSLCIYFVFTKEKKI